MGVAAHRQLDKNLGKAVVGSSLGGGNVETSIVALPTQDTRFVYKFTELILHNPRHIYAPFKTLDSPNTENSISRYVNTR